MKCLLFNSLIFDSVTLETRILLKKRKGNIFKINPTENFHIKILFNFRESAYKKWAPSPIYWRRRNRGGRKKKKNKSTYLIKTHPLLIFYIESRLLLDSAKKNGLFIVQRDAAATAKQRWSRHHNCYQHMDAGRGSQRLACPE